MLICLAWTRTHTAPAGHRRTQRGRAEPDPRPALRPSLGPLTLPPEPPDPPEPRRAPRSLARSHVLPPPCGFFARSAPVLVAAPFLSSCAARDSRHRSCPACPSHVWPVLVPRRCRVIRAVGLVTGSTNSPPPVPPLSFAGGYVAGLVARPGGAFQRRLGAPRAPEEQPALPSSSLPRCSFPGLRASLRRGLHTTPGRKARAAHKGRGRPAFKHDTSKSGQHGR